MREWGTGDLTENRQEADWLRETLGAWKTDEGDTGQVCRWAKEGNRDKEQTRPHHTHRD